MRGRYASLREGLVGAWIPSVSGSGLLLPDLSGNGNNGALTNMGPEDWVSSQYGRALDFDGSNDYVDSPAISLENFSASFFISHTGANAVGDAVSNKSLGSAGTAAGFVIGANGSSNQWQFSVDSGSGEYVTIFSISRVSLFTNNTWTHCVCTRSGSSLMMWVNGIDVTPGLNTSSSGTLPSTIVSNNSLIIGSRPSAPTRSISGQLDDIRIYNRVLREPEIKLLASRPGIGLRPQRRTMYYAPPTGARRRRILTSMP